MPAELHIETVVTTRICLTYRATSEDKPTDVSA